MIGKNLQKLRRQKKLTQEALAEKIGVARQTIAKWETAESSPVVHYFMLKDKPDIKKVSDGFLLSFKGKCGWQCNIQVKNSECELQEIEVKDSRLRRMWPPVIYRLCITSEGADTLNLTLN